jgi:hypothetical protein
MLPMSLPVDFLLLPQGYIWVTHRLTSVGFAACCLCSSFGGNGGVGPVCESLPLSESLEFLLLSEILLDSPGESE